jgi:hypothetical protein
MLKLGPAQALTVLSFFVERVEHLRSPLCLAVFEPRGRMIRARFQAIA